MNIFDLPEIIQKSIKKGEAILSSQNILEFKEETVLREEQKISNHLYHSDNIATIKDLLYKGYKGKIDLIYIDPPFFTMANYYHKVEVVCKEKKEIIEYLAYTDTWDDFREYLEMLTLRLFLMKELLSDAGTIYVHIDFRTVHYIKIIMDYIYGQDNFLNEVIWAYKSGGTSNKYFSRKHDNILVYTKTKEYIFNPQKEKSYNRGFKPYRFKGVKEYEDTLGWYTLVNLKDVWQIDMVGRTSKERVGYGTQKPEALLEKIVLSSSTEESIVADFFAGSGTTLAVAERHNRKWIGSDMGSSSILTIKKRLGQTGNSSYNILSHYPMNTNCKLELDSIKMNIKDGKLLLNIKLGKYILDLNNLKLSNKNRDLVNNILNEDSLALIDYIGIGYKKNLPIILFEELRSGDKPKVNTDIYVELPVANKKTAVYIKVIDVFGNESCKIIGEDEEIDC